MDSLLNPSNIATILGLIGLFKQEKKDREAIDKESFNDWLVRHNHQELKEIIFRNGELSRELENLIRQDTQDIQNKLNDIGATLVHILAKVDGFEGLSKQFQAVGSDLSTQAKYILKFLVYHKTATFSVSLVMGAKPDLIATRIRARIPCEEKDMIKADLADLVQGGYLMQTSARDYQLTRLGEKLGNVLLDSDPE